MTRSRIVLLAATLLFAGACNDSRPGTIGPKVDSESHFLSYCIDDADCGDTGLSCLSGVCTAFCSAAVDCSTAADYCANNPDACACHPAAGVCTAGCDDATDCAPFGDTLACAAGSCVEPWRWGGVTLDGGVAIQTSATGFVDVQITAESLSRYDDSAWSIRVENAAQSVVLDVSNLRSSQYGFGADGVAFIGPCDAASLPNTVTVALEAIYLDGRPVALSDDQRFVAERYVTCAPSADTPVDFDLRP